LPPGTARSQVESGSAEGNGGAGMSRGGHWVRHWVLDHNDSDEFLPLPPAVEGSRESDGVTTGDSPPRTTFRRHEDAGAVDVVDLPPLYSDIRRGPIMRYNGASAEDADDGESASGLAVGSGECPSLEV
jgi:hypothetical protein